MAGAATVGRRTAGQGVWLGAGKALERELALFASCRKASGRSARRVRRMGVAPDGRWIRLFTEFDFLLVDQGLVLRWLADIGADVFTGVAGRGRLSFDHAGETFAGILTHLQ
ncbi:hypothetical protein FQZ97_1047130 [compost metagenome]